MTGEELAAWGLTLDPNQIEIRDLGDGRYAQASRLLFHYTIKVGAIGDNFGYDDRYCYATLVGVLKALDEWNPATEKEPNGWHRDPNTGRRRPDGDPNREYIAW